MDLDDSVQQAVIRLYPSPSRNIIEGNVDSQSSWNLSVILLLPLRATVGEGTHPQGIWKLGEIPLPQTSVHSCTSTWAKLRDSLKYKRSGTKSKGDCGATLPQLSGIFENAASNSVECRKCLRLPS